MFTSVSGFSAVSGIARCLLSSQSFCCLRLSSSLLLKVSSSGNFGFNFESSVGSVDLMTRPINSCEGEYPDCNGVDLYASNAFSGSLDFFKIFFAVCTARSTSPFDLGFLEVIDQCYEL